VELHDIDRVPPYRASISTRQTNHRPPGSPPTRRIFADDENEDAIPNGVDSSPISEYETLKTIAADASPLTLPPQNELGVNPVSLRRYSGPSDGQPLSFVIIYETGHVAVHARENCAYEGQYQFTISDEAVTDLVSAYTNPNLDHSAIPTSVRKTPSLQRHLDSVWELTNSGSMHTRTPHRTHSLQLTTRSVLRVESIYSKQETTRRSRVP